MKTVRDACELQENATAIRVSDQVEQLDELIQSEGDGTTFFAKTFVTQGMLDLVVGSMARLAGASNQAIFHLKQAMGGGKTHLLIGLGLLAKNLDLRRKYSAGIAHIEGFGSARVAAFNGRNTPNEFFWGELAGQLGKADEFRSFWAGGPKAPDERDWLKLFAADEPTLILLDELPPYFHILDTQQTGNQTVAAIATRALANLLTAASKKKNVCVVVSDLDAAYDTGSKLINTALSDARKEVGRGEQNITPVDLATNEVFDILRKRLFKKLPERGVIDDVASAYARKLEEATKSKTASRGAESIADEISATYPFHPRLKNLVALFKDNEDFKQTRGLIEFISRLLKSVWERKENDVYLIGAQHFDLALQDVRDKLSEISGMRDVIAKDLWDAQSSAHAQLIDAHAGNERAEQVGTLVFVASLSTAHNAVKGLTREEMVECLISPLSEPAQFLEAFDTLERSAWYVHHSPEAERYYFSKQENLTKLLQKLATTAPQVQIDGLIRHRLEEMYKPHRKSVYEEVLALPKLEEVADKLRRARVLAIVSPDSKIPPEAVQRFFDGLTQKNNLCVLTGDKSTMGSIEKAAREHYAAGKAASLIGSNHQQREELERKQQDYELAFTTTVHALFDKVLFPRGGQTPKLQAKPLDMNREPGQPFRGEDQIQKTLASDPLKYYSEVEANFDAIREKAETLLWPAGQDEVRLSDMSDLYAEQAAMNWLPPRGLDDLRRLAYNRGVWEEIGRDHLTKKPKKKKTSVQFVVESGPDDTGEVRLRVNPQNAGPRPIIYYAENGPVSESSQQLHDQILPTSALRVAFLVHDPTGQYDTGEPEVWKNELIIRNRLDDSATPRTLELFVAPKGTIRYTLDGSEPRHGKVYDEPLVLSDEEVSVLVFAEAEDLEARTTFTFAAVDSDGVRIDPVKPAKLVTHGGGGYRLDSRQKAFQALKLAGQQGATFEIIRLNIGQGNKVAGVTVGEIAVEAAFIENLLTQLLDKFDKDAPVVLTFNKAHFANGHDLEQFSAEFGLPLKSENIEQ
ncbi:DUF499 domain-containing protein [Hymenobacter aquaticus]|uniref:DUF499 domain-containing protein n=1 Tax=Hymenobacter aquaticus TaxID=1867101 RepID=A0A4Z0PVR7_9BACT|nr:anti-phage-associated DUF499 domain-containing protein [Hymenobacter aquaticus]TGE21860.1 DUF499 domain-containing protein [Hymenobacter aquaticus]